MPTTPHAEQSTRRNRQATLHPSDIAQLALFLATDESCHSNGAVIAADAGTAAQAVVFV